MDTKKLHFFITLSKTGNMREAAQLLNISHAGLSKAIHTLEDELGTSLITKDGRGIKITPIGKSLILQMNNCLKAEEELFREISGTKKDVVRIGSFEVFSTYLSPRIIQQLQPHTEVSFEELTPGELENNIASGQIDFGISYLPIPQPNLDLFEITKIKMGLFAGKKYSAKNIAFEEHPFVIPTTQADGTPSKVKGLDGWPDHRIQRNIKYHVSLMETALGLVREGFAVGYFPKFIAELHNRVSKNEFCLRELPLPKKITNTQPVYAIKRKDHKEDTAFKALCKVLRNLS